MKEKRVCQHGIPLLGARVGDFWAWAYSDILNNTDRATFAEFVVGTAFCVTDAPREEWDAVDLRYGDKTVEVKSSAYVQSWHREQDPPSIGSFDLKERLSRDVSTNAYRIEPSRAADCYVFCVYAEKVRRIANILDVEKWECFVISTEQINWRLGSQRTAAFSPVRGRQGLSRTEERGSRNGTAGALVGRDLGGSDAA